MFVADSAVHILIVGNQKLPALHLRLHLDVSQFAFDPCKYRRSAPVRPRFIHSGLEREGRMSESTNSVSASVAQSDAAMHPTTRKKSRFGLFLKWTLIVFGVMQLLMRTVWEPVWGDALENLITYAQALLSLLFLCVWWFFFSSFSRSVVLGLGLPVVIALIAWIGSIGSIDWDGDMNITIHYRWEQSPLEKLREYRENAPLASTEKIAVVEQFAPEDMPAYRGIHRDGIVVGPEIVTDWDANPPREIWRRPIGGGYSSFSVVRPVAVTMEQRGNDEAVVCYDIETGREFWEHRYPAFFDALGGPGPRSTPTIHGDVVFSFGCYGDLFCLNLKTGEPVWHVNVLQQFGLPTTHWGMTSSPLIHDEHVIVNIGGLQESEKSGLEQTGNGLVAYSLKTGEIAWKSAGLPLPNVELQEFKTGQSAIAGIEGKTLPGYSSPMLAGFAGEEVILNFDGTAFRANDPSTGAELWKYPFVAGDFISVAQPIVFKNEQVMISAGYGAGSVMFQVRQEAQGWELQELWKSRDLRCKFSSPILHDGYVYGLDEGIMVCIDPQSGQRLWKGRREGLRGRYGHGQMLLTDGHIVVLTEKGDLVLIEPSPEELKVRGIVKVLSEDVKTWNPLTIAYGRAFVRNAAEVACYDLRLNPTEETATQVPEEEVTRLEQ